MSLCTTCSGVHPVRLLFSVESHHVWKAGWSLTKHFSAAVRLTGWVKPQRSELKKHWAQESGDFLFFLLFTNPMNKLLYGAPLLLKISVTCSFFLPSECCHKLFPPEHQMSINPLLKIVPTVALFLPVEVLPLNHILILRPPVYPLLSTLWRTFSDWLPVANQRGFCTHL